MLMGILLTLSLLNTIALIALAFLKARDTGVKKITKPTTELADFLDDIKVHGYGCVRLDPDSLIRRGPRR